MKAGRGRRGSTTDVPLGVIELRGRAGDGSGAADSPSAILADERVWLSGGASDHLATRHGMPAWRRRQDTICTHRRSPTVVL